MGVPCLPATFPFMNATPTLEEMKRDLQLCGWTPRRRNATVWIAPDGRLYRSPYRAWIIATGHGQYRPRQQNTEYGEGHAKTMLRNTPA